MRGFVIGCLLFAACNREYSISPKEEPVDSDDPGLSIQDPQDGLPDVDTDDPPEDTEVEDTEVAIVGHDHIAWTNSSVLKNTSFFIT